MKHIIYIIPFLFVAILSCTKKVNGPISASLGKPQPVTDVSVQNVPGGAVISYRIPNQEDLLSIKAVYTLSTGKQSEAIASFYDNKVNVLGFNDANAHEVMLYTINRAEEISDPVKVTINPMESPLSVVAKTVNIVSDFGGAQYKWKNEYKAPLTLEFLTPDAFGKVQLVKIITTKADSALQSIRGYTPQLRPFSVVIKDNYGNKSDTITNQVIPYYEEKLKKSKMTVMKLANDQSFTNWEGMDAYIIDDDHNTFGHSASSSIPAPFTIDMGTLAKVSRLVMFQRKFSNTYYNWGNPRTFDVYVRADRPSQNGNWSEWTKIMTCEIVKPSGSSGSTVTDEDMAAAINGHEFTFPLDLAAIRYIRVVIRSTWGSTTFSHPADVDIYGEPKIN